MKLRRASHRSRDTIAPQHAKRGTSLGDPRVHLATGNPTLSDGRNGPTRERGTHARRDATGQSRSRFQPSLP